MRLVAITGMGVVSSLGVNRIELWKNLIESKSGIKKLSRFDGSLIGVGVAGEVEKFDISPYLKDLKLKKHLNRTSSYLLKATHEALEDAGFLSPFDRQGLRTGLYVGSGQILPEKESFGGNVLRNPLWYLDTFPSLAVAILSLNFQFEGSYATIVNACTSGAKAIADAAKAVMHGEVDVAIAGGADCKITPEHLDGFKRLGILSENTNPETAMRPFDSGRNGTVISEGAGVIILEDYERARKRGANIYALVSGSGMTMDAFRLTDPKPNGDGIYNAMKQALASSGISVSDVGYINTHGTSTRANDRAESKAIYRLLGGQAEFTPVNSTKSLLGHSTAACGAIEAIVCALSLHHQIIHPTKNFVRASDVAPLDYVPGFSREHKFKHALSNSCALGGFNASLLFSAV